MREKLLEITVLGRFFQKDTEMFSNKSYFFCFFSSGLSSNLCPYHSPQLEHDLKLIQKTHDFVVNVRQRYVLFPYKDGYLLVGLRKEVLAWWLKIGLFSPFLFLAFILLFNPDRSREKDLADNPCWKWLYEWVGGKEVSFEELIDLAEKKSREIQHLLVVREKDLWHLKRENERLRQKLRKLKEDLEMTRQTILHTGSLTALGEFAAAISHELNNPLGIVLGFTQYLLGETPKDHPHYPKLKRIEIELERCQRIIKDLLAFARPAPPQFEKVDLNQFLEEVVQFFFSQGTANVQVECLFEEDLPLVEIDPEQMEQVILNLLKNACEAMEGGGCLRLTTRLIHLTRKDCFELALPETQPGLPVGDLDDPTKRLPQIETSFEPGDPAVLVEICDTGPGIPEDILSKIFHPFFTTKKNGTGLGLSISWKLIRRNRGIIRVKSSSEGTCFQIILPVLKEREE